MAKYARKRKGSKRAAPKRTRSKRSVARRRLRRGKMDSSNYIGVSKAIWNNMNYEERINMLDMSRNARMVAIQTQINRDALKGKGVQKLKDKLEQLDSEVYHNAKLQAAQTGKL